MPRRDGDHQSYVDMAKLKNAASATIINAQLRADETSLRKRTLDKLPELIAIIHEEQKKLGAIEHKPL